MSVKSNDAADLGCILSFAAITIVAIIYGKADIAGWFKLTPPVGRYQVVSGKTHAAVFGTEEVAAMVKIDTATGKSWVLFSVEWGRLNLVPFRTDGLTRVNLRHLHPQALINSLFLGYL